jgi:GntR family transcriptional regulator
VPSSAARDNPDMAPTPVYRQIAEDLRRAIQAGTLARDQRLPSESELAARYGVTRMTVRQAVDPLVHSGLVVRRQGAGTFVAHAVPPTRRLDRLESFTEEVRRAGGRLVTRLLACEVIAPPDDVVAQLGIGTRAQAVEVVRLRVIDRVPTVVMTSWLPHARVRGLDEQPLQDGSLYAALRDRFGLVPRRAEQRMSAVAADAAVAGKLGVEEGAPVLRIERTTFDDRAKPFEVARSWTRPGFELFVDLES